MKKCAKLASTAIAKNTSYELNGIILHHGDTVFGGHYTSLVRLGNSSWVHINDEISHEVSALDMDVILNRCGKQTTDSLDRKALRHLLLNEMCQPPVLGRFV
jgi:hypothetical protein